MKRKLIIMLSVLCFLVIVVVIEAILYFKNQQIILIRPEATTEPSLSPLGPPAELSTNFDPTKYAPRFMVESVNKEAKTLNLKFVSPHTWEGKKVTSQIVCENGDIKITSPTNSVGENVTIDAFIKKIQETPIESMLFIGLCSDKTCTEISKACQLYVAEK